MFYFGWFLLAFVGGFLYSSVIGVVYVACKHYKFDDTCSWVTAIFWPLMVPLACLVECAGRIARFSAKKTTQYLNRPQLPKAQARNKE